MEWSHGVEWSLEWSGVRIWRESPLNITTHNFIRDFCYEKETLLQSLLYFGRKQFGSEIPLYFTRFTRDLLHYIS